MSSGSQGHRLRDHADAAVGRFRRAGPRVRASTGWAPRCSTSGAATWTATSCARARSTGPTGSPRAPTRACVSARCTTARCCSCTTCSVRTTARRCLEVGSLLPMHATAMGKVLLAYHPYLTAELGNGSLPRFTNCTITDPKVLAQGDRARAGPGMGVVDGGVDRRRDVVRRADSRSPGRRRRCHRDLGADRTTSARAGNRAATSCRMCAKELARFHATSERFRGDGHAASFRVGGNGS